MKDSSYVKRTQKDYTMSFKLSVVKEVETCLLSVTQAKNKYGIQGRSTVLLWLRKYGSFDWDNQTHSSMSTTPEQKLLELEARVLLLEKQKQRLEDQLKSSDDKAIIFDMMISIAEKEYNIPIRKNSLPEQSTSSKKIAKKV